MHGLLPGGVKGIVKKEPKVRDDSLKVAAMHQQILNLVKQVSVGVRGFPSVVEVSAKLEEITAHPEI
eukprot:663446-Heterocapsa_arctica.AAC.1